MNVPLIFTIASIWLPMSHSLVTGGRNELSLWEDLVIFMWLPVLLVLQGVLYPSLLPPHLPLFLGGYTYLHLIYKLQVTLVTDLDGGGFPPFSMWRGTGNGPVSTRNSQALFAPLGLVGRAPPLLVWVKKPRHFPRFASLIEALPTDIQSVGRHPFFRSIPRLRAPAIATRTVSRTVSTPEPWRFSDART